ncbi:hypothetical protein SH449x_005453 [Pirellulaceae bacterium SH449]
MRLQLTLEDWWFTSQEFALISELEVGETITCSQLECSCTRVSSFELFANASIPTLRRWSDD